MNLILSCALACACLLSACNAPSPKQKSLSAFMKINMQGDPSTLDPRKVRDLQGMTLMHLLFEGLTRLDKEENAELALAQGVELSENQTIYTFHLRPSVWSNGDPVTAEDFVYAWKKSIAPAYPADQAFQLYIVKNAYGIKKGMLPLEAFGVRALDEQTLEVALEYPIPNFLTMLALPIFFPVNRRVDQANDHWAGQALTHVSNGPFFLKSWKPHDQIEVEKNPKYWDAKTVRMPGIQLMVLSDESTALKMFEKKELDWAGSPLGLLPLDALPQLKRKSAIHKKPLLGTCFIRINTERAPFTRIEVRRAFALALNRTEILEHVTLGTQIPATGLIPLAMEIQGDPCFQDGARETAYELMKQETGDLPEISLIYAATERSYLIAQAMQQQWLEAFGVHVKLEPLEKKVYFSRLFNQDYQLAIGSWTADFKDPLNFLEVFKYKESGSNNTLWENGEYIQLLDSLKKVHSRQERRQILSDSQSLLLKEMPIIPIFHYNMIYLKNERVEGVVLSSMGTMDFKWAYLQEEESR